MAPHFFIQGNYTQAVIQFNNNLAKNAIKHRL